MVADPTVLAALRAWLKQNPSYAYTAVAVERSPAGSDVAATLRVTVDGPAHTETVHVERGNGAGTDIRWSGGTGVEVRGPGLLHVVNVRMDVRDARILSPRGNDVRTADFARIVGCYAANLPSVRVVSSAPHAEVIALSASAGVRCGDEYGDGDAVSEDRLTFDPADGQPLLRERLSGGTVVERWTISGLAGS
jgi:hypothetical protein